jgi:hypothetical protein
MSQIGDGSFADRLYEQLLPFAKLDIADNHGRKHLWVLCDAIGAMFQQVEDLTAVRDDGLSGYANLLDINTIPAEWLGYLGQFVGVVLRTGFSDDEQREWVRQRRVSRRGRPATMKEDIGDTLTGTKFVQVVERIITAWHFTVITKPSETPDPDLTKRQILNHKPGPDTYNYDLIEKPTYRWARDTFPTYRDLLETFDTYRDLADAQLGDN